MVGNLFGISLSGLLAAQARMNVSANNVANARSTTTLSNGARSDQPYYPQSIAQTSLGAGGGVLATFRTIANPTVPLFIQGHPDSRANKILKNFDTNINTAASATTEISLGLNLDASAPISNDPYDPAGITGGNMASGDVSATFTKNMKIYDSLGQGHDVRVSFLKTANNQFQVEIYAANPGEVSTTNPDGLLAYGTVEFNGDGTLNNVSGGLATPFTVDFTNGALASDIALDLGTAGVQGVGKADGLSQFAGPFTVNFAEQNGAPTGEINSLEVNNNGEVIAHFTNGETRIIDNIPPGEYEEGIVDMPNVDMGEEVANRLLAKTAFNASIKLIKTGDEMLESILDIKS